MLLILFLQFVAAQAQLSIFIKLASFSGSKKEVEYYRIMEFKGFIAVWPKLSTAKFAIPHIEWIE